MNYVNFFHKELKVGKVCYFSLLWRAEQRCSSLHDNVRPHVTDMTGEDDIARMDCCPASYAFPASSAFILFRLHKCCLRNKTLIIENCCYKMQERLFRSVNFTESWKLADLRVGVIWRKWKCHRERCSQFLVEWF